MPLPVGNSTKALRRLWRRSCKTRCPRRARCFWPQWISSSTANVLPDTFKHKGKGVVDQNVGSCKPDTITRASTLCRSVKQWKFSRKRRPFLTGNEAFAIGAVAAGCRFYSAYPMTPASGILNWMADHAEALRRRRQADGRRVGRCQRGHRRRIRRRRAMCATSGGGFALMTEAIGMAGMIEAPVVFVEVQRGGPSTGIPTKTEQADLNQVYGASQGDFPRVIIAPKDTPTASDSPSKPSTSPTNIRCPVIIITDLQLSEHPETVDRVFATMCPSTAASSSTSGKAKRVVQEICNSPFSGVSPRALPGTANTDVHCRH